MERGELVESDQSINQSIRPKQLQTISQTLTNVSNIPRKLTQRAVFAEKGTLALAFEVIPQVRTNAFIFASVGVALNLSPTSGNEARLRLLLKVLSGQQIGAFVDPEIPQTSGKWRILVGQRDGNLHRLDNGGFAGGDVYDTERDFERRVGGVEANAEGNPVDGRIQFFVGSDNSRLVGFADLQDQVVFV